MRKIILSMGCLLSLNGFAQSTPSAPTVPAVPEQCIDELLDRRICAVYEAPATRGPVTIQFFSLVYGEDFPQSELLRDRYLDFNQWPTYLQEVVPGTNIDFKSSVTLEESIKVLEDGQEVTVNPHFRDYITKAPFPINRLHIRGVVNNWTIEPFKGANKSYQFEMEKNPIAIPGVGMLDEPEGLVEEKGFIHETPCDDSSYCDPGMFMVIFDGVIHPKTDILPRVTAPYIKQTIEDFLRSQLLLY